VKIIRAFNAIALLNQPSHDVFLYHEHVIAKESGGEVITPVIYPRLAWQYLGIQAHPEEGIAIALYAPNGYQTQKPGFFYWDGTLWLPTSEALYQSPEAVREGMESWVGAVQFHIRIDEGRSLKEVTVGYEVDIQLIEYMFNFAIPDWLSQPYRLNRITRTKADGKVEIPKGYNIEQILEATVRSLDGLPVAVKATTPSGNLSQPVFTINLPEGRTVNVLPNKPFEPVQLLFTVKPQIKFTEGVYQVEQAPCVVLRELDIREYHAPYRYEPVLSGQGQSELDFPVANFDLSVEVSVMATERADAQAIANQIMHKVRDEGCLYLPPVDLTLGCYVEGGIGAGGGQEAVPFELDGGMGAAAPSNIRGGLPTVVFRLIFKNLAS
jgi:hypothetical protein